MSEEEVFAGSLCAAAFFLGVAGAWAVARWGRRFSLMDRPTERSSHTQSTPKGGGIGILAAFLFSAAALSVPISLTVPAAILAVLSLLGDRCDIRVWIRLSVQLAAGIFFSATLFFQRQVPPELYLLIPLSAVFLTGTANFYNFMDGIDGIAGITGVVGFSLIAVYGGLAGCGDSMVLFSASVSLACVGFLIFNFPSARVFMGDVGSILLGFVFAAVTLILADSFTDFAVISSFIFTFYADGLTTMAVRIRDGERLNRPHRRHLYQLLANECGYPHWKVAAGFGAVQALTGGAVLLVRNDSVLVFTLLAVWFTIFSLVSWRCRRSVMRRGGSDNQN